MRLMIIGPQGVGKGTQSTLLSKTLKVPHISTGDLFRSHASAQTDLGRRAQEYMNAGDLVPDAVTNAMIAERLSGDDTTNGYLLDGFPRTLDQARWFTQTLRPERDLQAVILLEAPQEELLQRMLARRRSDDQPEIIHRRLELYRTTTQPLLDHYAHLLIRIDGTGTVPEVQNRIMAALTDRLGTRSVQTPDSERTDSCIGADSTSRPQGGSDRRATGSNYLTTRPPPTFSHRPLRGWSASTTYDSQWPRPGWTDR